MNRFRTIASATALLAVIVSSGSVSVVAAEENKPPAVGVMAPKLELESYDTGTVKLAEVLRKGPAVVMVLRGNPGYQCPLCTRQVGQFIAAAEDFSAANATVVMVYPGPEEKLDVKANEFLNDTKLPDGFHLLVDPDYTFTNEWHLRWDVPKETAYPSTFVIDMDGKIRFAKISRTHGDRAPVVDVITALKDL